ncbi:MAG: type II toxin-antitoxin system HigB family toxin [Symploca sp. SIO1B1]|nr:type II toxin-antitoxin system HigB family toxin [Symploca sp. SIO2D2]NER92312.1 type II toxin-antitoxin system HigB family toxin [Symploca sp. SIO1B1]
MRVISRRTLREFWEKHSTARNSLLLWYERVTKSSIDNFAQLRQLFPSADLVGNFIVFNIGGNNYRLITYLDYRAQIIFIRAVLTHADYDKENWKNDDWFNNS